MKLPFKYLSFFLILGLLESCTSSDFDPTQPLLGKWLHFERAYSIGGPLIIEGVDDGETYQFFESGVVEHLLDGSLKKGKWELMDDVVSLDFDDDTSSYSIEVDDSQLKMSFRFCFEGCYDRYKRQ